MQQESVALYSITQAKSAVFSDMYIGLTFLFFIHCGSKRVVTPTQELVGKEGDLLIFPPESVVTMENRPFRDKDYHATGVSFPDSLIEQVFPQKSGDQNARAIQHVPAEPDPPAVLLPLIKNTLAEENLPNSIRQHRMLEPLIWLRDHGYHLPTQRTETPLAVVRRLIETDIGHDWRARDVARTLGKSEPTLRRWLAKSGQSFARILLNTRLENGLALLQTTTLPISTIALDCGFKTPSHFSEAFRKRFGLRPKEIRSTTD